MSHQNYRAMHGACSKENCSAILNDSLKNKMADADSFTISSFLWEAFCIICPVVLYISIIVMLYWIYKSYWSPIRYIKELTEVGFDHIPAGPDRGRLISRAQANRRLGKKLPPPYPNGWFAVAEARELTKGKVMTVDALGENLCVYRGEDGVARVVDAYCPHLGANLGYGGEVKGSCITCPFHKWKFDEGGRCVEVPGEDNVPKGVSIKTWTAVEAEGAIWIWYDAEGRPPLWEMVEAPECKEWGYRGMNAFTVSSHIQDIPENGADMAHLNAVHSPSVILPARLEKYPNLCRFIGHHTWRATWARNEDHTASMTLAQDYHVFGKDRMHMDIKITQVGPAHVVLRIATRAGPYLFSQSVTPLGPNLQRVVHRLYSPTYNALASPLLIIGESRMIARDILVWNSKKYMSAPMYVKTDKTIRSFRTWYSQFYSDHSTSFKDAMQNPLDW